MTPQGLLPAMEVETRLPRLIGALAVHGCDVLIVTNLINVRYLTGFTGSFGMLVVGERCTTLVTDGRYTIQASDQLTAAKAQAALEVIGASGHDAALRSALSAAIPSTSAGQLRVGLEAGNVTWAFQRHLAKVWPDAAGFIPTEGAVENLRRIKDSGELARITAAAQIADEALANVKNLLEEGISEKAFGLELDAEMRRLGAAGPSFETIVASGPNSARPHHRPTDRLIERGEPVVVDFGATVDGYRSDMTRTLWLDELSDPVIRTCVEVVARSQAAGVAAVRAGVSAADVDAACREVISDAGFGEQFVHGTGHGVGLDIHEAPALGSSSMDTLQVGYVVTVEPGVYLNGVGGVRIEDMMVVGEDGADVLTRAPKDLL